VAANDARGRLLLLDRTSGRIIRLDPATGAQDLYARVPDLPTCGSPSAGSACSPAVTDLPPMPDYAAWGPDGSLYVTDYQQAVIWRIPPGGGTARVWLADKRLDGNMFGTAGIFTTGRDHRTLLFTQASSAGLGELNPTTGKLYSVRIGPGGKPTGLRKLWESGPAEAPDGFALTRSGHVYMAMAGPSSQIVEVDANGKEIKRFGAYGSGDNGSSVPFDTPSSVNFLGTRAIIANQSFESGSSAHQAILDLESGEPGAPIYVPRRAGLRRR
jgi:sugar lactone lactonase YvrE